MVSYAQIVKEVRLSRGQTQKDFATSLKVTQRTVSRWENDADPPSPKNFLTILNEYLNLVKK